MEVADRKSGAIRCDKAFLSNVDKDLSEQQVDCAEGDEFDGGGVLGGGPV